MSLMFWSLAFYATDFVIVMLHRKFSSSYHSSPDYMKVSCVVLPT